jgi:hypothetical protein
LIHVGSTDSVAHVHLQPLKPNTQQEATGMDWAETLTAPLWSSATIDGSASALLLVTMRLVYAYGVSAIPVPDTQNVAFEGN